MQSVLASILLKMELMDYTSLLTTWQLYHSMEMLALNPEVARRWGETSREKARDLTPEAGAEKWVQVFESIQPHAGHPAENKGSR